MSVIVKGMEMPKMCCYCKFREPFLDFPYCDLDKIKNNVKNFIDDIRGR